MRVFETLAAGGFLITDQLSPQSGLENLLQRDEHYVDYENEYDLIAKLRHYLAHPRECLKIARAGQQAYLQNHQPAQRVRDLLTFAFDDGAAPPPRDQRAFAGSDEFGYELDERVRLYEICQTLSLRNERLLVVVDAALGGRIIADLVDLPRLKIVVATSGEPSLALKETLNRLGALDQIEFIEGEPSTCDVLVMDVPTIAGWRDSRNIWAHFVLAVAMGNVADCQIASLTAKGFSKIGKKLWGIWNQPLSRNQQCPCGSGKRYKHCHGALEVPAALFAALNRGGVCIAPG